MHPMFHGITYNYVNSSYEFHVYLSHRQGTCIHIFLLTVPKSFLRLSGPQGDIPPPPIRNPPERLADTLAGILALIRLGPPPRPNRALAFDYESHMRGCLHSLRSTSRPRSLSGAILSDKGTLP